MTTFEKVMTRDVPLMGIVAWADAFSKKIPQTFPLAWPVPIFIFRAGAVESWRPTKLFHGELPRQFAEWLQKNSKNTQTFEVAIKSMVECNQTIQTYKMKDCSPQDALAEIKKVIDI